MARLLPPAAAAPLALALLLASSAPLRARAALNASAACSAGDDGFALKLFPSSSPAVCLDGSPAGYYIRPGVGPGASVFLLELEGARRRRAHAALLRAVCFRSQLRTLTASVFCPPPRARARAARRPLRWRLVH